MEGTQKVFAELANDYKKYLSNNCMSVPVGSTADVTANKNEGILGLQALTLQLMSRSSYPIQIKEQHILTEARRNY